MGWEQWLAILGFTVSGLGAIICGILWYLITGTIGDMRKLETNLSDHKTEMARDYARTNLVNEQFNQLHLCVDNIERTVNKLANDMSIVVTKLDERTNHKI